MEKELEEESETEEIEYVEADSELEEELEAESDIEDSHREMPSTSKKASDLRQARKPRLEIEYEVENVTKDA